MPTSTARWPATCAAAAPTSASAPRCIVRPSFRRRATMWRDGVVNSGTPSPPNPSPSTGSGRRLEGEGSSRRGFLKGAALAGGGLVVACFVPATLRKAFAQGAPAAPNAFIRIAPDGTVTVLLKHSEMGQGVWTSLPMVVAEELGCNWNTIAVEHAPAAPEYAHTAFGMQMTGGST